MPDARFAFCNVQRFDENNSPIGNGPYLSPSADYNGHIVGYILEEPVVVPSALMVRRDAFKHLGGFSGRQINEDYELIVKLAAECRACYVPEALALHRAHGGSRSLAQQRAAMLEYLDIVQSFLSEHPNLPLDVRARGRRGLANVHLKLARFYIEAGDRQAARRHLCSVVRIRPWDRRAFLAYLSSFRKPHR
jgi:GT2 family glycosyltransferase